jgi:hypothetical protein
MATKKSRKGVGGRPRLQFDLQHIEGFGAIMATYEEMAAVLGCSKFTIEDRMRNDEEFSSAYKRGQGSGKVRLRRAQWQAADRGNVTMMIWLGKQWLGQTDQMAIDATVEDRTGVAHVPPEVTHQYWEDKYGTVDVDGDSGDKTN